MLQLHVTTKLSNVGNGSNSSPPSLPPSRPPFISLGPDHMILEGPVATSAPLGTNATFYCTVQQAEISWRLNGQNIKLDDEVLWRRANNYSGVFRGEAWSNSTVNTSTLIATASEQINNTLRIACSAFGGYRSRVINSPYVFLTVFGKRGLFIASYIHML